MALQGCADLGYMHSKATMDASTAHAQEDAEIPRGPGLHACGTVNMAQYHECTAGTAVEAIFVLFFTGEHLDTVVQRLLLFGADFGDL